MEVRGDIGLYNPGTDEYTVWMSSQTPHIQRLLLTAFVTGIPEHKVRCIAPDVGGAFGTKIFCYADMALVMLASKLIGGRPVKWVETRRENYQSTTHGRDHITYLEIAGSRDGDDHRAAGQDATPTSAAASRRSARASPRRCTPGSSPAATRSPMSTARSPASTPTRRSSTPTAAPGVPRRPTSSSGRWTCSPTRSGWIRAAIRRKNFIAAGPVPVREPVGPGHGGQRREDLHRLGQLRAGP